MPSNGQYSPADLVVIVPSLGWPAGYGQPRLKRCHDAMTPILQSQAEYTGKPNEIYRDLARQVYYRNLYLQGRGNPAAIPGTSKHGDGLAEDWDYPMNQWGSKAQAVWVANEAACGYSSSQGRADGEPWHKVSVAEPSASVAGGGAIPLPIIIEMEDDMPVIVQLTDVPKIPLYALSPGMISHLTGEQAAANLKAFKQATPIQVNTNEFNALLKSLCIPVNKVYHFNPTTHSIGSTWCLEYDLPGFPAADKYPA